MGFEPTSREAESANLQCSRKRWTARKIAMDCTQNRYRAAQALKMDPGNQLPQTPSYRRVIVGIEHLDQVADGNL